MKTKIIPLGSIKFDEETYPRIHSDWVTVSRYTHALRAGADFPPITVSYLDKEFYLVDGYHWLGANKAVKNEHITAEVLNLKDKKAIYLESVKRNVNHGKQFSTQDVTGIMITLQRWNMSKEDIAEIVRIPADKIAPFIAKRMVRITGTQEEIPLKAPLKNLAGFEQGIGFDEVQEGISSPSQQSLLHSMKTMLENGWFNTSSKEIIKSLESIYELLDKLITK